jgi:uncharacterized GH25 family protein
MFKKVSFIVALFLFSLQQAAAHDAWLQPKDGGLVVACGHGGTLDAYDPQNVKEAKAVDCKGKSVATEIGKQKDGALITSKSSLSWMSYQLPKIMSVS